MVEDELGTQKAIKTALEKGGYEVLTADDGSKALALLQEHTVDLIISDIIMPVMDGFVFYKELKLNSFYQDIPVIILSAKTKMEETFNVLGCDCFLGKPFNSELLLKKIEAILRKGEIKYLKAKKVLVAGNTRIVLDEMVARLREQDAQANLSEDAADFVQKISNFDPEIVLVEVDMDGIPVREFIERIQSSGYVNKPVIFYQYHPNQDVSHRNLLDNLLQRADNAHEFLYLGRFKPDSFIKQLLKQLEGYYNSLDVI